MNDPSSAKGSGTEDVLIFSSPQWLTLFILFAAAASVVPFLAGFFIGLSVRDDYVFGLYAMIGGFAADPFIRRQFNKTLLAWKAPRVPFIYAWALVCLYVIVFSPFEGA